jgi:hypothetical protein
VRESEQAKQKERNILEETVCTKNQTNFIIIIIIVIIIRSLIISFALDSYQI